MTALTRLAVLVLVSFAALTAVPAVEAHTDGPNELESVWIADRWAARDAPGHPNHCASGNRAVTRSNAAVDAEAARTGLSILGYADGWVLAGGAWAWDFTRCTWTTREDLGSERQCWVDAHEQMHYVIGPEHVGPLDPRHPGAVECFTHGPDTRAAEEELRRATAEALTLARALHRESKPKRAKRRAKRSKAQIARSIRYRKAKAARSRARNR